MSTDDNYALTVKFEKDFYGKQNVEEARADNFQIRHRIQKSIGVKGMQGIS